MRTAILVAAISLAACHRPRPLTARAADLGHKMVAIVTPVKASVHVDVDVGAIARQQIQQRVGAIQPIAIHKSSTSTSTPSPEPTTVEPTVTRHQVDTGSDQVWKNVWRDGQRASCEKVDTFDSCQATCSEHMRQQSMQQIAPNAGKPEQCQCTQGTNMCK